jgi:hypothetical protein
MANKTLCVLSLFQNRLFCHRLLQFFGLGPAKLRILKVAVPKTEVLEQPLFIRKKSGSRGFPAFFYGCGKHSLFSM